MSKLHWRASSGKEVAQLLVCATLQESAAVGSATVYRLNLDGKDKIAITLPDGQALIIENSATLLPRRRRQETAGSADDSPAVHD